MTSLVALFPHPTLVQVLSLFLIHPDEEFYQADIAQKTSNAPIQAQRALKRIEQAGLVTKKRKGKMLFYKAQRNHPAFEDLKRVFLKTVAVGDAFREAISPLRGKIRFAFIYGSYVRGEEAADSDIDLFLIGNHLSLREIVQTLGPVMEQTGRECNPVLYSLEEFQNKRSDQNTFIQDVIANPKIGLLGDAHDFAKIAG